MFGSAKFSDLWSRRTMLRLVVLLAVATLIALATTWRPAIALITSPARSAFSRLEVERGGTSARIGDCAIYHSGEGGRTLAGSRALPTPFGLRYSDNLTPDPKTGIRGWSYEAFRRPLKDCIARDVSHLDPALPYDHLTLVQLILLDFAVQRALVLNQHVVNAPRPEACSRLNTIFKGAMFLGSAIGSAAATAAWNAGGWNPVALLGGGFAAVALVPQHFSVRAAA